MKSKGGKRWKANNSRWEGRGWLSNRKTRLVIEKGSLTPYSRERGKELKDLGNVSDERLNSFVQVIIIQERAECSSRKKDYNELGRETITFCQWTGRKLILYQLRVSKDCAWSQIGFSVEGNNGTYRIYNLRFLHLFTVTTRVGGS